MFAEVWRDESMMLNPNREAIRNTLDDFLTSFAADFIRANR